jgi:hypothetical protein
MLASSRTPPRLLSGLGLRFPRLRPYTTTAFTLSTDCFAGASTISATPTIASGSTACRKSARGITLWNACTAIMAACTRLDHAVKAIRLRFADKFVMQAAGKLPAQRRRCRASARMDQVAISTTDKHQLERAIPPTPAQLSAPVLATWCLLLNYVTLKGQVHPSCATTNAAAKLLQRCDRARWFRRSLEQNLTWAIWASQ